ncbi:hypothetical protein AC579_2141 [Pseudocercospora musae]|uniref:Uncharacterized protein n=1 Tax=Pseudocercospora musae TaxID=113226 RepID=A0A139GT10_9PEZI|nr:hypothetical protein AC579_2141 [Pseudocercospora musae]
MISTLWHHLATHNPPPWISLRDSLRTAANTCLYHIHDLYPLASSGYAQPTPVDITAGLTAGLAANSCKHVFVSHFSPPETTTFRAPLSPHSNQNILLGLFVSTANAPNFTAIHGPLPFYPKTRTTCSITA